MNEYNDCLTPKIRNEWVSQGIGAYVNVPDENGTSSSSSSTTTTPMLEWCCTTEAVQAKLCEVIHFGRMMINQTAFDGNHRFIPIARVSEVDTTVTHGELIQPHAQGGTYVVIIANCNPHGRPLEVLGPWTWIKAEDDEDGLYSNITSGSHSNSSSSSMGGNNKNETAVPGKDPTGNNSTSTTNNIGTGNGTAVSSKTQVPAPTHSASHPSHPTTSSSSVAPHQAPTSSRSPSVPNAPSPTHVPHATASPPPVVSGSGGGSTGSTSLGAAVPASSPSKTSNNNSNNSNNATGAGVAILLVVALLGFVLVRKRLGRTHSLVGSDGAMGVNFDDLEMVETRKEEHFTDFGDNHGYMPNFS